MGFQGPLSSIITERLGVMESIFIVHLGGLILISVPLFMRGGGKLTQWRDVPWYTLSAGVLGLVIIAALSFSIPRVGMAPTVTLIVAGQLVLAAILDHFGWLGAASRPIDMQRVIGILVVFVGVWLIVRK